MGMATPITIITPTSMKSPAPRRLLRPDRSASYLPKARLIIPAKPESPPLSATRCGRSRRMPKKPRCPGSATATISFFGRAAAGSGRGG